MAKPVIVRQVWASNLYSEFCLINRAILNGFCFAAIDTEFPGTIFNPHTRKAYSSLPPQEYYSIMKQNVDELRIIQLGLTLVNDQGELPDLNSSSHCLWQFNFSDFDQKIHPHNKDSISLLEKQGVDFSENKKNGIDSLVFAGEFRYWVSRHNLIWITFQGAYDFALLINILTRSKLPDNVGCFMSLVRTMFGVLATFDVKLIARYLGYHGGLENVGKSLGLLRVIGKSHQAGSDSLLTMQVYMELCNRWYSTNKSFVEFNHKLYGLTTNQRMVNCSP